MIEQVLTRKDKLRKLYKKAKNQIAGKSINNTKVVFVFGEMRSGTNMLIECLDRSLSTDIYNETDDDAFHGYALRDNQTITSLVNRSRATHIVFKALADSSRASGLLSEFQGSRAIWIYRCFEDVVNSAMRKWKEHNRYLHDILYDTERAGWRATNVSDNNRALVELHYRRKISEPSARALIWYVRNCSYFEQGLDRRPDVQLLKYEDLVKDPGRYLTETFRFIDLKFRGSYVGHVSSKSVSRFKSPEIDMQVRELCESLTAMFDARWSRGSAFVTEAS